MLHIPVLLKEVIAGLLPKDNGFYIDGTFGNGGYSCAILEAANCHVLAIDRDPEAIKNGQSIVQRYAGRLSLIKGRFSDMFKILQTQQKSCADGITLDLGVSSMQLDQAERGFSFQKDGPLDMRMEKFGPKASDLINTMPEEELANIIFEYGEEHKSRQIARAIVQARQENKILRTEELANIIRKTLRPYSSPNSKIDLATRTFQAIRIYINDEMNELEKGLDAAEQILCPYGRLAVVSFHSLEDRKVKKFLRQRSDNQTYVNRHTPETLPSFKKTFRLLSKKAITASLNEIRINPRARSAKLRLGEKLPPSLNRVNSHD
ncbi:MAG: 16S rRNA (cytosine(1402)-N(4))-methyltransferase RsmH [Alphaproteobacteria bacterium]|nr:16S rRNA (cytosine(1402)-N(4))-methyltransferase RsmH [Alphaproteobacteria bacterium]